jgi:preprotein translocase subunit SecA/nephrocystin-3
MDNNPIDDRHIRVFISSTFRDMEKEREQLIKKVFPMLRKKAAKRGVVVTELDLRWGVTQEESENGKVLEICLNEIDNSRPFFIGLLGDRYGWCPSEHELDKNHNIEELFPWVRQAIAEGKSVTEMEFLYGALSPQLFQDKHIDAYFWIKKNAANDDERLEKLKTEVRENLNYPCAEYTSPSDLGNQVAAIFEKILDERFPQQKLSEVESFRLEQELYKSRLTRTFLPIEQNIKVLDTFLQDDEKNVIALVGEQGSGKSATIANWTTRLKDKTDYHCITCFMQASNNGSDINYVLSYVNEELRIILGRDITDNPLVTNNDEETFKHLFQEAQKSMNLLLILDGVNVLDEPAAKLLNWMPDIFNGGGKIILTTTEEDATYQSVIRKDYDIANISIMDDGKAREQYIDLFLGQFGKSLSVEQKNKLALSPITSNPGILHTILVELKNNGSYEDLDQAIDVFASVSNSDGVYSTILDNAERSFGKKFVIRALLSIAVSRNGLDENTLMAITEAAPLHWSQFFCAFSEHLYSHNGFISFINNAFKEVLLTTCTAEQIYYARWYILTRHNTEEVSRSHYCTLEFAYQKWKLNDCEALNKYISNRITLWYLVRYDEYHLRKYWATLSEAHLPRWKWRYFRIFDNYKLNWIGNLYYIGSFMIRLDEYQLSLHYSIQEIIHDKIFLHQKLSKEDKDLAYYYMFCSLGIMSDSLLFTGHVKLALIIAKLLRKVTDKHPDIIQSAYFSTSAKAAIGCCQRLLGKKNDASELYDSLLRDDKYDETKDDFGEIVRLNTIMNAIDAYLETDLAKAENCFAEASNICESYIKKLPNVVGEIYIQLLLRAMQLYSKDITKIKLFMEKALEVESITIQAGSSINNTTMAFVYSSLASILAEEEPIRAQQYCDRVLNEYLKNVDDKFALLISLYSCVIVYSLTCNFRKAKDVFDQLKKLPMDFKPLGDSMAIEMQSVMELCHGIIEYEHDVELGIKCYHDSIAGFETIDVSIQNVYLYAMAYDKLGRALFVKENNDDALQYLEKAVSLYNRYMSEVNDAITIYKIMDVNNIIGDILLSSGKIIEAKKIIQVNLEKAKKLRLKNSSGYTIIANTYTAMADVLIAEGKKLDAQPYYIKAIDAAQEGNLGDEVIVKLKNSLSRVSQ